MTIRLEKTSSSTAATTEKSTIISENGLASSKPANDNSEDGANFVTIIHFNDCYNVEAGPESSGAAGFLTGVNQYRHLDPMVLFSGDIISPSFMSTFTKGEQMIPVLDKIGVHCAVFGNHEFDYGVENLVDFTRRTNFPWLLSNVVDKETSRQLGDGQLYHIIERSGVKFGLIGLIEEEWLSTLSTLDPCDVIYEDFVVKGRQLARYLKSDPHRVDYVIALTHSRTPNDIRLADSVPEIDLILGGHDHDYEIIKRPNCYIIKSGTDFREFSLIKIKLNSTQYNNTTLSNDTADCKRSLSLLSNGVDNSAVIENNAIVGKRSILSDISIDRINCRKCKPDDDLAKELEKFVSQIDEKMGKVLGQFNCDLDGRFSSIRRYETNLGNFVTDIMLASTHADLAILNSGTLRSDRIHPKGDFTMRDLFNILGYIDPIAVLEASGLQIWQALENGVSQWPKLEGRFPQVSGCSFAFDPSKPAGKRIDPTSITVGDEPLVLDKLYRMTTKAYLASGKDGYDMLKECKVLVPGDETPDLTTSILNHFEAINIVKSNRRTHHRQSIICLSRSSLIKLLDTQHVELMAKLDGNNNTRSQTNEHQHRHHSHHQQQEQQSFDENEEHNCLGHSPLNDARLINGDITSNDTNGDGSASAVHSCAHDTSVSGGGCCSSLMVEDEKGETCGVARNGTMSIELERGNKGKAPATSTPLVGSSAPTPTITSESSGHDKSDNCDENCANLSSIGPKQHEQQEQSRRTLSVETRQPRYRRMMSLNEIEHEQCKMEPKIEGRIRILGNNNI